MKNLQVPLNVTLISTEHIQVSAARNRGLRELNEYKYVGLLDSDDKWPENFVERMRERLENEPKANAVTCDRLFVKLKNLEEKRINSSLIAEDPIAFMIKYGAFYHVPCFIIEKWSKLGGSASLGKRVRIQNCFYAWP